MELRQFGSGRLHLVVNRVRKKLLHSMHATIDDAMDKAGLPSSAWYRRMTHCLCP